MIELPTERSVVTNYNPKLLILMGKQFAVSISNSGDYYRAKTVNPKDFS